MATTRRSWTTEQKLAILKECEQNGVTATLRKHGVQHASYYRWKNKYELDGQAGLDRSNERKDPELLALQLENARLKKLVAYK
jgi:transposase-like protein